jgi:sulfonate transport system substrate-binding protein
MKLWWSVCAVLSLVRAVPAAARAEAPVNIRLAWAVVPGHLYPVFYEKKALLPHYGTSYTVELVHFKGSAPEITSLATGDLDIAALGFSSVGLALQNAHMDDLRVIGDATLDGVGDYFTTQFVVAADSDVHRVEDLKGKVLATNGIGGATYMAVRKMLLDHGLEEKRDYTFVEMEFPNMLAALREKKIDFATLGQPAYHIAQRVGGTRTLFTMNEAMGGETQTTLLAARAPFIAAHRAALVDFFADAQRAMHWFQDSANRAEATALVAHFTRQPESDFEGWLLTRNDNFRDPDLRPKLAALQRNLNTQKDVGLLKIAVDVQKQSDLSLVDEAAKRAR